MIARFFLETGLQSGKLTFTGAEFHHMVRVTRHQVGDTVRLFDGTGSEALAEILHVTRNAATLEVGPIQTVGEEPGPKLTIGAALPKGSRAGWLVEKAVELGVWKLVPIQTSRTVVQPRETKLDMLRMGVIMACKQCDRSRLMSIDELTDWKALLAEPSAKRSVLLAHPGGAPFTESLIHELAGASMNGGGRKSPAHEFVVLIGPEGGFTVDEVTEAVTHGARLIGLGPRLLRVETAVAAVAAILTAAKSSSRKLSHAAPEEG